jgi:hypothetical protein
MKFLKALGWIFVPYIMIFFQWKKIGTVGKAVGTVWAVIALIIGIAQSSSDKKQEAAVKPATTSTTTTSAPATSAPASSSQNQDANKDEAKKEEAPKSGEAKPQGKVKITKAQFDKVQTGMTYEEVVKILGGPGELMSEAGEKGTPYYTVMYQYEGNGLGANANFTFQGGKLEAKAQFGLE